MREGYTTYSGWWIKHPYFLRDIPKQRGDLVNELTLDVTHRPDDFFETEREAWEVTVKRLTEMHDQAVKDLEFCSRITDRSAETIKKWIEEAEATRQIAIAGLSLSPI